LLGGSLSNILSAMNKKAMRDLGKAQVAVDLARKGGASFAEVRILSGGSVGLSVQDGRAERMGAADVCGCCVRLISGRRWGFASSDGLSSRSLAETVKQALALAECGRKLGRPAAVAPKGRKPIAALFGAEDLAEQGRTNPGELSNWAGKLLALERAARSYAGKKGVNSIASYGRHAGRMIVASSRGTAAVRYGRRSTCSLMIVAAGNRAQGVQRWSERVGGTGQRELLDELAPEVFSRHAAERVLNLLKARPAPSGSFPVVLDPATGGVFVHECLGHNAEADLVLSGQSLLEGKLGKRLCSAKVTVVDDPTIAGAFGSYDFDSEGTPAARTEIISRGVLSNYLHSLETAARMKVAPSGHGRADGYSSAPLVRMSNTFFAPGRDKLADMIAGIDKGLLLEHGNSGHVLSEKGNYTVQAGCGRLIKNGKLDELVRDVAISGTVLESLRDIDAVSDDFELNSPGYCGKDGQDVPVDDGGAYVRLKKVVLGGRGSW
jgi:TldD protein